jgi:ubiquinone/menaquinone biosynthesis C-methylase UbiE
MSPWDLSEKQWSNSLLTKVTTDSLASLIKKGKLEPWSKTLLNNTACTDELLDLGSGTGSLSAFLAWHGRKATLVDFSQENLNFSNNLFQTIGLKGTFYLSDLRKPLLFADNSFDVVFSVGVLEYLSDKEVEQLIKEAFRVARKTVIMITPNASSLPYRVGRWYSKVTHSWEWGGDRPFYSLKQYFRSIEEMEFIEFTVGTKQAINFLKMFNGFFQRLLFKSLLLNDNPNPSMFRQGFVLISIGKKRIESGNNA